MAGLTTATPSSKTPGLSISQSKVADPDRAAKEFDYLHVPFD